MDSVGLKKGITDTLQGLPHQNCHQPYHPPISSQKKDHTSSCLQKLLFVQWANFFFFGGGVDCALDSIFQ